MGTAFRAFYLQCRGSYHFSHAFSRVFADAHVPERLNRSKQPVTTHQFDRWAVTTDLLTCAPPVAARLSEGVTSPEAYDNLP